MAAGTRRQRRCEQRPIRTNHLATAGQKAERGLTSGAPKALARIRGHAAFLREAKTTLPVQHRGSRRSRRSPFQAPTTRAITTKASGPYERLWPWRFFGAT